MGDLKKTLGGMPRRAISDSIIPPPPSADELRPGPPPRGTRTPAVNMMTPRPDVLPEHAPGWMKRARRLALALETAIDVVDIDLAEMAAIERAFSAYEMGGSKDDVIVKVSHLCERAHTAIRERAKGSVSEACEACAEVLYAGLPRSIKRYVEPDETLEVVREMRGEADLWVAVVHATSRLLRWDVKARELAAHAIRAAIDSSRNS